MLVELNSVLLNEVVHVILLLVLIVVYVNTIIDRKLQQEEKDRDFSMFVLFSAVYIGLMLIWLPIKDATVGLIVRTGLSSVRVLSGIIAYNFFGGWLLTIIEKNMGNGEAVPLYVKRLMHYGVYVLFILSCLLLLCTHNTLIANIPILAYYLLLEGLVLYYHGALGKLYTSIITLMILPDLLLQAQEWWNYTPANIYLVLAILIIYSRMWVNQQQKYLQTQRLIQEQENKLIQYKTQILISQIGPHFIYNTLSTIAALCLVDAEKAQKLTIDFADYLRSDLKLAEMQQLSSFESELKHVKKYLEIEKVRFGKRLNIEYDIQEKNFELPSLSLQPIVENAVKHGVTKKAEGGSVQITTQRQGDYIAVIVADDGIGCRPEDLEAKEGHYGLSTTRERLAILLNGELSVESRLNQGTTVIMLVKIPEPEGTGTSGSSLRNHK